MFTNMRSVLPDNEIIRLAKEGMINPFEERQIKQLPNGVRAISWGTSSYGYDVRCGTDFKIFTNVNSSMVDPKNFTEDNFVEWDAGRHDGICIIPPNSFALARSFEKFDIPRNVMAVCLGKSTYARCGIIVNVTPLEPAWRGDITLEFSNTTPLPAKIYAGEGCAQLIFYAGEPCTTSYKDRGGKYQDQIGITLPRA